MSDDESTQVIIEDVQSPWHKKMMETAYREHEHAAKQRYLWTQRVQRLTPKRSIGDHHSLSEAAP